MVRQTILVLIVCGACSTDNQSNVQNDAPGATVRTVSCAGVTPVATVVHASSNGPPPYGFVPSSISVNAGEVVEFTVPAAPGHYPSDATLADPGLNVIVIYGDGDPKCLMFTQAGTFGFYSPLQSYNGTVTVH
ncbi:MAG: hypothetical protein JWO36_6152 [Myxococcales bacterium]|nr:hypothetical protein [Myxococcales bacterium]